MKKARMVEMQENELNDFDKDYLGSSVRLCVNSPGNGRTTIYERTYNPEKGTFSKPQVIGGAEGRSWSYTRSEVGNIITEKVEPVYGLTRWVSYVVTIADDDSAYENPRMSRDWDNDPRALRNLDDNKALERMHNNEMRQAERYERQV